MWVLWLAVTVLALGLLVAAVGPFSTQFQLPVQWNPPASAPLLPCCTDDVFTAAHSEPSEPPPNLGGGRRVVRGVQPGGRQGNRWLAENGSQLYSFL